jgi:hypothetical protein
VGEKGCYDVTWSGADHAYRYVWRNSWTRDKPPLLVVGLIPSHADECRDDATVRFCGQVARCPHPEASDAASDGFGAVVVVNMYSRYLSTGAESSAGPGRPSVSHTRAANVNVDDLIGPANDSWIKATAREVRRLKGAIVICWGDGGWSRHGRMLRELDYPRKDVWCLATNADDDMGKTDRGFPCHPSPQGSLRRVRKAEHCQVVLKKF